MPIWMPATILNTGSWQTTTSTSLTANSGGWGNYTLRMFIPQASLLVTGGSQVRITLTAASSVNLVINDCYFGQASGSYSATSPAFAGTPTQVLFSGAAGTTVTAGTSAVSDGVSGSIPAANGICIACNINNLQVRATAASTPANFQFSYKAGATDSATVAASGYTSQTGTNGFGIFNLVEVFA